MQSYPDGPDGPGGAAQDPHRRVRDRAAAAAIVAGAGGLVSVLYFVHPLAAAAAVCIAVILGGVFTGMD